LGGSRQPAATDDHVLVHPAVSDTAPTSPDGQDDERIEVVWRRFRLPDRGCQIGLDDLVGVEAHDKARGDRGIVQRHRNFCPRLTTARCQPRSGRPGVLAVGRKRTDNQNLGINCSDRRQGAINMTFLVVSLTTDGMADPLNLDKASNPLK
jgi:hypothetical protein